jgi:protein-S-isoprenylcysteine O-methyltransferase Ste14
MSWSAWLFVSLGQGTPDPKHPPAILVQEGPYGYSRNPLVLSGLLVLAGAALLARSLLLLLYVPAFACVLHLYHVRTEEPELAERFGQAYLDYQGRVPRWLPRLPALSRN